MLLLLCHINNYCCSAIYRVVFHHENDHMMRFHVELSILSYPIRNLLFPPPSTIDHDKDNIGLKSLCTTSQYRVEKSKGGIATNETEGDQKEPQPKI